MDTIYQYVAVCWSILFKADCSSVGFGTDPGYRKPSLFLKEHGNFSTAEMVA